MTEDNRKELDKQEKHENKEELTERDLDQASGGGSTQPTGPTGAKKY